MMNNQKKSLLTILFVGASVTAPVMAQDVQAALNDLEAERFAKAGQALTQLATSSPTADNQFYLGYYLLKSGQPDQAKTAFDKGAAADGKNQLNNVGLAGVALAKGDLATATAKINEAVDKSKGKDVNVLVRAGEVLTMFDRPKSNDPAKALEVLQKADERDKKNENADIEMAMGDAYFLRNDGGNAVSKYENALTIKPNLAEANYKIGRLYLRGKNYKLAQDFFNKAIENDPEYAPTYRDLAEAFFGSRAYKTASKNMDLYLQKSQSTDPEMILRSAQFDFLAEDYQKSIAKLDQLKGKVNNPIIDRIYGWSYAGMGQNQQAIETLTRFIQNSPDKVIFDDYKYLGRAFKQLKTPEGDSLALINLEKAAPQDTTENLYRDIAGVYQTNKQYDKAINAWTRSINFDTAKATPTDYFNLGFSNYLLGARVGRDSTMMMNGDTAAVRQAKQMYYTRADSAFQIVNQKLPEWPTAYFYRGQANYFMYPTTVALSNGKAVPFYEKYIELQNKEVQADPAKLTDPVKKSLVSAYKSLAAYSTASKDEAKAKEYFSKVLEIDPNDKDVLKALEPPKATPTKGTTKAPAKKTTASK